MQIHKFFAKLAAAALFTFIFSPESNAQEPASVRIAVMLDADGVPFHTTDNLIKVTEGDGTKHKITKNHPFSIRAADGRINMSGNILVPPVYFKVIKKNGKLEINDKKFEGDISVNISPHGKLDIVEILPMEKYLLGVVGSEMPPSWPLEALKAQAIASRSYAYANLRPGQPYDLTADVRSQVYAGIGNPGENVKKAVEKTEGMVLKEKDNILIAYFHSYCGGTTETPNHIWEKYRTKKVSVPEPLKKPIKDIHCSKTAPKEHKFWSINISDKAMLNLAKKKNSKVKRITKLARKTNSSGRTSHLTAYTDVKNVSIDAIDLRTAIGPAKMKSTFITSITKTKNGWTIKGKGYGHGAGMCQWGAKAMADSNKNYKQILGYYYPGASIEKY